MRFLYKYSNLFESLQRSDLLDFCENYLAYLLDDESVRLRVQSGGYNLNYYEVDIVFSEGKSWDSIKDLIIPFLHQLKSNYKLLPLNKISTIKNYDREMYDVRIIIFGTKTAGSMIDYKNIDNLDSYSGQLDRIEVRVKK